MRRIRGPHDRRGYAVVEIVLSITVLALFAGVLVDLIIVSAHKPKADAAQVSPGETELAIARFVSDDVLQSVTANAQKNACGLFHAALVTTERSTPTASTADETVAYSVDSDGLTRTTCVTGKLIASSTTVVSGDVIVFSATCRPPGQCGSVHIEAQTSTGTSSIHSFALDLDRKQ